MGVAGVPRASLEVPLGTLGGAMGAWGTLGGPVGVLWGVCEGSQDVLAWSLGFLGLPRGPLGLPMCVPRGAQC